jgi:hypothetical protein
MIADDRNGKKVLRDIKRLPKDEFLPNRKIPDKWISPFSLDGSHRWAKL